MILERYVNCVCGRDHRTSATDNKNSSRAPLAPLDQGNNYAEKERTHEKGKQGDGKLSAVPLHHKEQPPRNKDDKKSDMKTGPTHLAIHIDFSTPLCYDFSNDLTDQGRVYHGRDDCDSCYNYRPN